MSGKTKKDEHVKRAAKDKAWKLGYDYGVMAAITQQDNSPFVADSGPIALLVLGEFGFMVEV